MLEMRRGVPYFVADDPRPASHEQSGAQMSDRVVEVGLEVPAGMNVEVLVTTAISLLERRSSQRTGTSVDVHSADRAPIALDLDIGLDESVAEILERVEHALSSDEARTLPVPGTNAVEWASVVVEFDSAVALERPTPELRVSVEARGGSVDLKFSGSSHCWKSAALRRVADNVQWIADAIVQGHVGTVEDLPLPHPRHREELAAVFDGGPGRSCDELAHQWFREQVRSRPDDVALRFEHTVLTYGELGSRVDRLAGHLRARGVRRERAVAVCVRPSFDVVVAMLAVLEAGGVYVPLDPTHPVERIATIVEDVEPVVVLTHRELRAAFDARTPCLCLDGDDEWKRTLAEPWCDPVRPEDAAYIIYTSGTTGRPKGVVATHGNLSHYLRVARERYGFTHDDVFCSLARYTFSISLFELLSPVTVGGSLWLLDREEVLDPARLAQTLEKVTVVHAGASLLRSLFNHLAAHPGRATFPRMRHASSGGDMVPADTLAHMLEVFPRAEIFVIYGCTEIACMGLTHPVQRDGRKVRTRVGRPFPGVQVRVVDAAGRMVPFGVEGEICFSGLGIFREYLHRPDLTASKFVEIDGRRFYQTGDLGRVDPDGDIEILGRRDFQVKVRGVRIELGEIETAIRELGLARETVVTLRRIGDREPGLVAFVVDPTEPHLAIFRKELARRLPDYMLPTRQVVLNALPLTTNGKLDRRAISEMPIEVEDACSEGHVEPRDAMERSMAAVFARRLGRTVIGIDDDFFELGGDSLLAVVVISELENVFGLRLPTAMLFAHPTVRALARCVQHSEELVPEPIALNQDQTRPKLFMLAGVNLYADFARRLEGLLSVHGVFVAGELTMFDADRDNPTVSELARDYVGLIRRHQPRGPYRVAGLSFGGIIAYEVARQLEDAGEEVSFLGMIDAVLPQGLRGSVRSASQRWRTLDARRVLRALVRRAGRRVAGALEGRKLVPHFLPAREDADLMSLEERRQAAYRVASLAYVKTMRPRATPTTLVVSGTRISGDPLADPSCGWSTMVPRLRVTTVHTDHLGLVREPHVAVVADVFWRAMQPSLQNDSEDVESSQLSQAAKRASA